VLCLITGLPGHGKTLYTLNDVEKLRIESGRDVYYNNIPYLDLDWIEFENPDEWYLLPKDAIIVMDEGQRTFPVRGPKDKVPRKCTEFETHRHNGHDVFIMTQDAKLLDVHLRRLAGKHIFLERKLGAQYATAYTQDKYFDTSDRRERKRAEKKPFKYPKHLYDKYQSATIHTVKRRIPKAVYFAPFILGAFVFSVYNLMDLFSGDGSFFSAPQIVTSSSEQTTPTQTIQNSVQSYADTIINKNNKASTEELTFAELMTPEIEGLPFTSPFYREQFTAETFPKPNCVSNEKQDRCICYSQQVTRLNIPHQMCLDYIENGFFDPTYTPSKSRRIM
jgi:hypothetical protein